MVPVVCRSYLLAHMCVDVWWLCSEFCHFICLLSSDSSLPLRSFPEVRRGLGSWCSVSDVPVRGSELKERPGRRHPLFARSCPASCPRGGMAAGYGGSRALVFLHHSSWCLQASRWCSLQCCAGLIVCGSKICLLIQSNITCRCLEEYVPHKRVLLREGRVVKNVDHQAASCGLVWSEMIHNMTLCQMDFCWAIVKRPGCCFSTSFEKTMGFGVFVSPPIVALNNTSLKLQVFSSFKRPKIELISQKCNKIIFLIVVYLLGHKKVWSCNFKFCGFSREHVNRNWLNNWQLRANQNSWG